MNRKICLQVLVSGSQVLVLLSFSWKVIYLWFMDLAKFVEEPLEVWPGNLKIKNNTWYVYVLNFFSFRRRTYTFNPLHQPYYNSYNSLINTERKITTIIWVIYLISLANESVITWTIIRLRQRAKWQPEFNQAPAWAGVAPSAARHPQLSCLRVELSSQLKTQVTSHLIPATIDARLSKTKVLSTFSPNSLGVEEVSE